MPSFGSRQKPPGVTLTYSPLDPRPNLEMVDTRRNKMEENKQIVPVAFNEEQLSLIKTTVAKGTTNDQLRLFLYTCKRTGLDPLAKQIHCIVRNTKNGPVMSIQTAIDGYRLVADRSGKYAGNDDPVYDNEEKPTKATVTVYKIVSGVRCAFTATARWEQYYPGELQGFMWKKMPHLMLGKCAEALALRKAFPAELSGLYTNEEMQQAESMGAATVQETHVEKTEPAHVVPENKTQNEPTHAELLARAEKAKLALHQGEAPKTSPSPVPPHTAPYKMVTGILTGHGDPNAGGFVSWTMEGQQREDSAFAAIIRPDHETEIFDAHLEA